MKIRINSSVHIEDATSKQIKAIKEDLTLPNPLYHKLERMGKSKALFATKRNFTYYKDATSSSITVPLGYLEHLRADVHTTVDERTSAPITTPFNVNITLRDYQEGIIEAINPTTNTHGIINLSTGWGKTIVALKLIEYVKEKTIIIVPTNAILKQFQKDLHRFCDYEPGLIQGSTMDLKDITIASLPTLRRRATQLHDIANRFGMCIVDEAHQSIPEKSIRAVTAFNTRYRYGLTGTPDRGDGQGKAIFFFYGKEIVKRELETEKPTVRRINTDIFIAPSTEYQEIIEEQVDSELRNQLIARTVTSYPDRKILILTKRIRHYELIAGEIRRINPKLKVRELGTANQKNMERLTDILQELKDDHDSYDVLLGTFSLLSTGVDIPRLDTLVIAGDLKSHILARQSIGRVLRLHSEKQTPLILDFVDNKNGILMQQGIQRYKQYRKHGWVL